MKAKHLFLLFLLIIISGSVRAQFPVPQTEKAYIFHKGKRYKVKSNWLNVDVGYSKNLTQGKKIVSAGLDYNFYFKKKTLWKIGYSRNGSLSYVENSVLRLNDLHAAIGLRNQTVGRNLAFFLGAAKVGGINFREGAFERFSAFGLFGHIELIKKVTYDTGIGVSIYGNYNSVFPIAGLRISLYFSNAYKEKFKGEDQY